MTYPSSQPHVDKETSEIPKLKLLVAAFKKKYDKVVEELASKEKMLRSLKEEASSKAQLVEENQALSNQLSFLKSRIEQMQKDAALQKQNASIHVESEKEPFNDGFMLLKAKWEEADALRASYEKQCLELTRQVHAYEAARENHPDAQSHLFHLQQEIEDLMEQGERDKQKIEKLAIQLHEKDKRIHDLQRLEISIKKAVEQKQHLEEAFEAAQNNARVLEEEKRTLQEQLTESKQHTEQLDRVIHFLRERSEEAHLQTRQLQEDYQKSQDMLHELTAESQSFAEEKQALKVQWQKEEAKKLEAFEELQSLHAQFEDIKSRLASSQTSLTDSQDALEASKKHIETLETSQRDLKQQLELKAESIESLEREMGLIKQTLIRGLREARDLQAQFEETVEEKVATAAKLQQAQNQINKHREQLSLLQDELDAALDSVKVSQAHLESMEKEKSDLLHALAELSTIKGERDALQVQINQERSYIQSKEQELMQVQQHLARKVKETSLLEDRCEDQQRVIHEQQQSLVQNRIKMAELQTSVEMQAQQQKVFQEQLHDAIKSSEGQLAKWEEKYFALYEKWQTSEARIKELEKIEEKQKHVQGLLANLGNIFETPIPQAPVAPPPYRPPLVPPKSDAIYEPVKEQPSDIPSEPQKVQHSLFNMPKPPGRTRQNFLE